MRGIAIVALAMAGACNFTPGAATGDAGPDGPPPVSVGFAQPTTLTDEAAGTVPVRVILSAPADAPITVDYAFVDGPPSTAARPADYLGSDGTLTFAPGDVEEVIELTVGADALEEPDEEIRINLRSPTGGAGLGAAAHTVTISANTLPRINFSLATSMATEGVSPTLEVTLDKASQLTVSATIAVTGGTATASGTDFTLSATTVTFQPGDVSETVNLTVVDDTLDEDDETAIVEIQNPINVVAGTVLSRTHTIQDNDAPPSIAFTLAASSVGEDATGIDVEVSLSTASGKQIRVPFSVDNTSSAAGTDYAIPTMSPLMFAAGDTARIVRVNVVNDALIEGAETVVVSLGTPMNATLGATTSHTVTINDDDASCLGDGSYAACFANPAGTTVTLMGTLNTDTSPQCATPLSGWTGQPDTCFVVAETITVNALEVSGLRPLALFASGNLTIAGTLDVSSSRTRLAPGPGAFGQTCPAFPRAPNGSTSGGGGGAGGSFRSKGGDGGNGNGASDSGGLAAAAQGTPTTLRAGCRGQDGGRGNSDGDLVGNGGLAGFGGGALYVVAGGTLTINSGVAINASGAAGTRLEAPNSGFYAGGGGGGSGGMIKLHASTFSVSGARLLANGGGASSGADSNTAAVSGGEADAANPTTPAPGGTGGSIGGPGGNGFAGTTQATSGGPGASNRGGGGGGGGGGHIEANLPLTGATVSTGP